MGGKEAIEKLKEIDIDVKALFRVDTPMTYHGRFKTYGFMALLSNLIKYQNSVYFEQGFSLTNVTRHALREDNNHNNNHNMRHSYFTVPYVLHDMLYMNCYIYMHLFP
jgi:hypothetical protein